MKAPREEIYSKSTK